ncbi:MAG: hypothetical protein ABH816_04160 [Candidatus Levyibacteriota bacterium]
MAAPQEAPKKNCISEGISPASLFLAEVTSSFGGPINARQICNPELKCNSATDIRLCRTHGVGQLPEIIVISSDLKEINESENNSLSVFVTYVNEFCIDLSGCLAKRTPLIKLDLIVRRDEVFFQLARIRDTSWIRILPEGRICFSSKGTVLGIKEDSGKFTISAIDIDPLLIEEVFDYDGKLDLSEN